MAEVKLRVAVVTPLSEELCHAVEASEPRVAMIRDQILLPPMRYPGDHAGDPTFRRDAQQQSRFEQIIGTADALYGVPWSDPAQLRLAIEASPQLRWVHLMAAGGGAYVKAAGLSASQLSRVQFTTSAGVHGIPLAEFALFGLLAGAKNLPRLHQNQAARVWPMNWLMKQLSDQTILILGLGGVGRTVARMVSCLGATVLGLNRRGEPVDGVHELINPADLPHILPRVDAIVVAMPGTDTTNGLLSAELLSLVKPGVTVVNVGRGSVIETAALIAALEDGRVGFAALDVFDTEPLPETSRLWELSNVLISPHTAARAIEEDQRIAELFAANATKFLDGAPMTNRVDITHFY